MSSHVRTPVILSAIITDVKEKHEINSTYISYKIEMEDSLGKTWEIEHRFSEFHNLHQLLSTLGHHEVSQFVFPSSMVVTLKNKLELGMDRVESLNNYLEKIISLSPLPKQIEIFLGFNPKTETQIIKGSGSNDKNVEKIVENRELQIQDPNIQSSSTKSNSLNDKNIKNSFKIKNEKFQKSVDMRKKKSKLMKDQYEDSVSSIGFEALLWKAILGILKLMIIFCVFRISSFISSAISSLLSFRFGFYINLFSSVLRFGAGVKLGLEVTLSLALIYLFIHRITGFLLTCFLQSLLYTENGGFHMGCSWLSLRWGLDHNEIVLTDFFWRNPPGFKKPYFVRVARLSVVFDLMSLWRAVWDPQHCEVQVLNLELGDAEVHIEKGDKDAGLNLWAALGASNSKDEVEVRKGITQALAEAGETVAHSVLSSTKALGSAAKKIKNVLTRDSQSGPTLSSPSNLASDEEGNDENPSDPSPSSRTSLSPPINPIPPSSSYSSSSKKHSPPQPEPSPPQPEPQGILHWGVPWRFRVQRLMVYNLNLFAKDFLTADHSEGGAHIHLEVLRMANKELTAKRSKTDRSGVYLDELTWKLVNRLISELLSTNKIAMMSLLAAGGASQTSSVIQNVASATTNSISDMAYALKSTPNIIKNSPSVITGSVASLGSIMGLSSQPGACAALRLSVFVGLAQKLRGIDKGRPIHSAVCKILLVNSFEEVKELRENSRDKHLERKKTHPRSRDKHDEIVWNESFELGPVKNDDQSDQHFVAQIYEPTILSSDHYIGYGCVKISDLFGPKQSESSKSSSHPRHDICVKILNKDQIEPNVFDLGDLRLRLQIY